jgi:hypothetical protein
MDVNENDLFNNSMISNAKKNMTEDEINRYKRLGEEMFSIDFGDAGLSEVGEASMEECKIHIEKCISSGLHISYLSTEEKNFMFSYVGDKWWEKYGFNELDLEILYSNF